MVNGDVDGGAPSDLSAEGSGYPSGLRDAGWARLAPLIPEASPGGRPRKTDIRAAMNAIFHQMGYDAGKQVKGRKIHALVDTEGLPMRVVVHSAAIQDRDGAGLVLDKIRRRFPWLELIWADGVYNAWQVDAAVAKVPPLRMEIVKRRDDMKGFVVLPRRWVVERTFSWFGRNRRLAKDFENLAETLGAVVALASIQLALRRLARA
jgi:transposase